MTAASPAAQDLRDLTPLKRPIRTNDPHTAKLFLSQFLSSIMRNLSI